MLIESPLFQSAMELLGHAISHYDGDHELDRKLVILHLANAIELILKDLLLESGGSIYKNPKETLSITACLSELKSKNIEIPLLNKIELLIDERNALQHRFGSPNRLTTIFYMKIAEQIFREILNKHYGLDYYELIAQFVDAQALSRLRLTEPSNDKELEKLQELARIHPLGAFLAAWSYYERMIMNFATSIGIDILYTDILHRPFSMFSMDLMRGKLKDYEIDIPEELRTILREVKSIRNRAAHGLEEPSQDNVVRAIQVIEETEKCFEDLNIEKIKSLIKIKIDEHATKHQPKTVEAETSMSRKDWLLVQRIIELDKMMDDG